MNLMAKHEEEKKVATKVQANMIRQAQKAEKQRLKEKWAAEKLELRKNKKIMKIQSAALHPKAQAIRKDLEDLKKDFAEQQQSFLSELETAKANLAKFS